MALTRITFSYIECYVPVDAGAYTAAFGPRVAPGPADDDSDEDTAYGDMPEAEARVDKAAELPPPPGMEEAPINGLDAAIDAIAEWRGASQTVANIVRILEQGKLVHIEKEKWYKFSDTGCGMRWDVATDVNIHEILHNELDKHIKHRITFWEDDVAHPNFPCEEREKKVIQGMKQVREKIRETAYSGACITKLKSLVSDRLFAAKLDANPNLIGFNDGVYDLRTAVFRPARPDDYVSRTVGYDFPGLVDDDVYAPKVC